MRSMQFQEGDWETEAYAVTARRENASLRPPRRESPRFSRRGTTASSVGGVHQRRNKRCGL